MAPRVKRFRLSSNSSSSGNIRNPHEISRDSVSSDQASFRSAQGLQRTAAQTDEEEVEDRLSQRRRPLPRAVTNPVSSPERRSPFKLTPPQQQLTYAAVQAFALTFLVLFFSSWIALASAVASTSGPQLATVADTGPTASLPLPGYAADENVAELGDSAGQPELFNTSSAFLAAIIGLNANASEGLATHLGSTKSPPVNLSGTLRTLKGPQFTGLSTTAAFVAASNALESVTIASENDSNAGGAAREFNGSESPTGDFVVPPVHAIVVTIVLLFVILGTVVGNVLVCIAVCMVRKLRRPCNYLLVSLALSDLCVAVLVMPMALLYEVLEKWNFGTLLCDIWVSFDVLCCTASILNLCAISVDRYLAITKPLEYGVKRTPRRMMLCVALVWLAAACISLPPLLILGNEHVDENGDPICAVCQNFAYQIYATLGSFYIPLSVMLFVYYQIFRAARRIVLEEKRAQTHLQHALNGTGQTAAPPATTHTELGSGNGQRHSSFGNTSLSYSTCGGLSAGHAAGGSGSSGLLGSPHQKKLRFQLAKEKKASTTLGIIMSAFTICWLPFFILALIRPFVESETTHVPQSLSSLFLWLGYANSLLNPIIYATLNRDFRKPFQEILYFRCSSLNTMMRENYYQDQYGEPPSQRVMLGDERHGARESFL